MKYAIMTNLWLLAQMRQPWMSIYQDLDRCTFTDFLDTLLDRDNFNFYKEVDDRALITPSWTYCLSYELELRKDAFRLCKEQQYGIQAALWATLRNTEHRMKHWLQLVAIPNTPCSSGGPLQISQWKSTETGITRCWSFYACPSCSCLSP